jgi:hypothetical protein
MHWFIVVKFWDRRCVITAWVGVRAPSRRSNRNDHRSRTPPLSVAPVLAATRQRSAKPHLAGGTDTSPPIKPPPQHAPSESVRVRSTRGEPAGGPSNRNDHRSHTPPLSVAPVLAATRQRSAKPHLAGSTDAGCHWLCQCSSNLAAPTHPTSRRYSLLTK